MKDLDFDELDRAVNSLMTNVPKTATPPGEEKIKTLDITPTLSGDAQPQFDRLTKLAAEAVEGKDTPSSSAIPPLATPNIPSRPNAPTIQSAPRPAATAPAARRAGRFMDVVHPSSDMNTKKPDMPVSRQGVTIEPRNNAPLIQEVSPVKSVTPSSEPVVRKEEPAASNPGGSEIPSQSVEASAPASDWPDPLDIVPHASLKNDEDEKEKTPEPPIEAPQAEAEDLSPAPLTSPFLPDAKVEKRPLGGISTNTSTPAEEPVAPVWEKPEEDEPKTVDDPNAQLPANPSDVEPLLPEELSNDLMAVEADTTHDSLKEAHDATKDVEAEPEKMPEPKTEKAEPHQEKTEPVSTGPTSIPQQYHEEPSTGDQKNGSIYDTDSYHQPLAHPAKKKSGWLWVLWIVIILVIGAGAGAALYFSNII
ncbi:MAG TPA: hypothetical protein VLG36_05730 [Candidatus Chromulinivoraceae bacterium]|nr:hypothetical protein [Candidatus Chromulinivoraceae bacterium]